MSEGAVGSTRPPRTPLTITSCGRVPAVELRSRLKSSASNLPHLMVPRPWAKVATALTVDPSLNSTSPGVVKCAFVPVDRAMSAAYITKSAIQSRASCDRSARYA